MDCVLFHPPLIIGCCCYGDRNVTNVARIETKMMAKRDPNRIIVNIEP